MVKDLGNAVKTVGQTATADLPEIVKLGAQGFKRHCKSRFFFFFFRSTPGILLTYRPASSPRSPLSKQGRNVASVLKDAEDEGEHIVNEISQDFKRHCKSCFILPLVSY